MAALLVRLVFLVGMTGSDDLHYAKQAQAMSEGRFIPGNYFANFRVGLIVPTALAYRLFGISTTTTIWFVMLCSLLGTLVAILLGRELFGTSAGLWAGALYAVFPIDVVEAGMLLPDICVAALTGLALVCVLRAERERGVPVKTLLFVMAGVLVGAGYLCKMTGLMTMAVLVAYLLVRRKNVGWLLPMLAGLAVVIIAEGSFYHVVQGDFLLRFRVEGGASQPIGDGKLTGALASLTEYPRAMFLSIEEFGPFWYLFVAAVAWAVAARPSRAWVVALWVAPLWLMLEFGFAGVTRQPFPVHVPRYLTLVTIPAAALIGAMFARLQGRRRWVILSVLSAATLAGSLFFAGLHATLVESTVWNSRQVAARLKELPRRPTYVLFGRSKIDWFAGTSRLELRELYRGADNEALPLDALAGCYVVVDHRLITFQSEREELKLPDYIVHPPATWTKAAEIRNNFSGVKHVPIRLATWVLQKGILGQGLVAKRFERTLGRVSQDNECVIYHVPNTADGQEQSPTR